jgi:outer membrane beta-barrel protein
LNLLFTLIMSSLFAQESGEDVYTLPKLVAVQSRQYYVNHDLTFQVGYLPMDSFNKSVVLGGSYTYYLSDFLAWEVINANYAINQDTGLKDQLRDEFNADTGDILDYPTYYATTSLLYTPLYNKSLLFNKSLVFSDISFVFGGGMMNYDAQGAGGVVQIGAIFRFFTAPNQSIKFDFRTLIPMGFSEARVNLSIIIGYSFQLGAPPKGFKEYKPTKTEL